MSTPVTCLILTYNEAERIAAAIGHALLWADEVVVVDKWSTDGTDEIARKLGALVARIPFSRQGHENLEELVSKATHDWVWLFTPGEIPTPECIRTGRSLISDDVDAIYVPMRYYSFGVHAARSPWSGGHQPRLYHRHRVEFTGYCHNPIRFKLSAAIKAGPECYVLHQTHATAADFLRSHADYMLQEAERAAPEEVMAHAFAQLERWIPTLDGDPALLGQALGWRVYWFGVALHAWERTQPDIRAAYAARAQEALRVWWTKEPAP